MSPSQHFPLPHATVRRPKLSILIKSYNHAKYIGQTIESILAQPFQDFEIVVTDDASSDGTADVAARFGDPRILIERLTENQGISGAMNATIARACGHYLAILNSDDWALPNRFVRQVSYLDSHPEVALVCGLLRFVDEEGADHEEPHWAPPRLFPDFEPATWSRHFFFSGNAIAAPSVMLRREAYEVAGPYDMRLLSSQDFDMWTRMSLAGLRFVFLDEEVTAYRVRDNQMNISGWERRDAKLRLSFETSKILGHFTALDTDQFSAIFASDPTGDPQRCIPLRVADLALRSTNPAHHAFALDTYFKHATVLEDIRRLVLLSGSLDTMGVLKLDEPFAQDEVMRERSGFWSRARTGFRKKRGSERF